MRLTCSEVCIEQPVDQGRGEAPGVGLDQAGEGRGELLEDDVVARGGEVGLHEEGPRLLPREDYVAVAEERRRYLSLGLTFSFEEAIKKTN